VADQRHTYSIRLEWTGNQGTGTSAYRAYLRAHEISAQGKAAISGSSGPVFRPSPVAVQSLALVARREAFPMT
jgi:hypothetical protein